MNSFYPANKAPLAPSAFCSLPLGAILPKGWLRRQLEIQADGLTGHIHEFWPDLGPNSGWLGGDGESWERGPYYLDGLIPIAFLLQDENLISRAKQWMNWMLRSQKENGWFGPERNTDWWPLGVALKAMTQFCEATADERVIPLMQRFFACVCSELPSRPLESWAVYRWADTAISAIWLANRTNDPTALKAASLLMRQGYDWARSFVTFAYKERSSGYFQHETHVVNNAMAIKTPGVSYALTGDEFFREAVYKAIENLDRYHGQVTGVFSGDEHLAGLNPSQGTELCAVAEYMFSLEVLLELLGDPIFGDRVEKIAFNALPATFSPDMWAHQYDQQANQVLCKNDEDNWWVNNGPESNTFGVEPNFGCCTANMHQAWPKLASHLWMATPDDGLAAVVWAPCTVNATVKGGVKVRIDVDTNYPFEETITVTINVPKPVSFPLHLRCPGWTKNAIASVSGKNIELQPGSFAIIEREWKDGDVIEIVFPMSATAERRFHGSVSLTRGALVYSMPIGEKWVKYRGEEPHADYEIYPTTPWNYGLSVNIENPEDSIQIRTKPMGDPVFSPDGAPIEMFVKGRIVPEWQMQHNAAGLLPESPIKSSEPIQTLRLIPYGCTNLRITEFPLIDET